MASVSPVANRSGTISWRVQFRIDGRPTQETFATEEPARSFGKLVDRVGGEAARAVRDARQGSGANVPTLAAYVDRYLDPATGMLTGIQPGTRAGYRSIADRSFLTILGDIPVDAITKADVGRWITWQESQPSGARAGRLVSAKTVRNYHALLSSILQSAVEGKLRDDNPAHKTRMTEGDRREGVLLTHEQFRAIHAQIPDRYKPLILFLVVTGCRWGEATAMTWADVTTSSTPPTVRVNKSWKKGETGRPVLGPPKSKKGRRTISITAEMVTALGKRGAQSALLFPGDSGHIWYGGFNSRIWRPAVLRAGVDTEPNIHDLRHTSASWLAASGTPMKDLQVRMGHESIQTTAEIYTHVAPSGHAAMAAAMGDLL